MGARTLREMLEAARRGDDLALREAWFGTSTPQGKLVNDGLKQVLPSWARGASTLDALAGIVVVDESVSPATVTVHWERVPRPLRAAAASLASELVDIHYPRPKGGRPKKASASSEETG